MKTKHFESLFDEFTFGKYAGECLCDILDEDPQYVAWAYENAGITFGEGIKDRVLKKIGMEF